MTVPTLSVYTDRGAVMQALAGHITALARQAIAERGRFTWALAGGSTPKELYELLAAEPFASQIEWPRIEVFWGDERCVPPDSPQSNYRMAQDALLSRVPVAATRIHRMAGELTPSAAAERYNYDLQRAFPNAVYPSVPPSFDLVLLGMGDDGHTASLFPGTTALQVEDQWACAATKGAGKTLEWRLTLTFPVLNAAREVTFLVLGAAKRTMLDNVLNADPHDTQWPSARVRPINGRVVWFVDTDAAPPSAAAQQAVQRSNDEP